MHHFYQTSHQANFIVNDVSGSGYCGFLFTCKDTTCFLNNFNSSQVEESEHIVGSFVPVVQEKVLRENLLQLPVNNVINNGVHSRPDLAARQLPLPGKEPC